MGNLISPHLDWESKHQMRLAASADPLEALLYSTAANCIAHKQVNLLTDRQKWHPPFTLIAATIIINIRNPRPQVVRAASSPLSCYIQKLVKLGTNQT